MVEPSSTEGMENLMNAMRRKQNIALAREAWEDASLTQRALVTILDARAGANLIGMSMAVIETTRGIFNRLHRVARNRGHGDRAGAYLRYVEDLHGIMRGRNSKLFFSFDSFSERSVEETVVDAKEIYKSTSQNSALLRRSTKDFKLCS